jgi:PAS domain S-box-containing protein
MMGDSASNMANGRITLDLGSLRRRAEERLRERKLSERVPEADAQRLLHELEVHQVELEMQNEELREARVELESALARYTEMFEFAPIGYVTISLDGVLHELNHAAARLLGAGRSQLLQRRFDSFVVPSQRPRFAELLARVLDSEARETSELELMIPAGPPVPVQLLGTLLARAEPMILVAIQDVGVQSRAHAPPATESGVMAAVSARNTARRG